MTSKPPDKQLPPTPTANNQRVAGSGDVDFKTWDSKQVANWLAENGFADANALFIQHEITGDILLDLNYNFLRDIGVASVGERAKILALIKKLAGNSRPSAIKPINYTQKSSSFSNHASKPISINSSHDDSSVGRNSPIEVSNSPITPRSKGIMAPMQPYQFPGSGSPKSGRDSPLINRVARENMTSQNRGDSLNNMNNTNYRNLPKPMINSQVGMQHNASGLKFMPRSSSISSKEKDKKHQELSEAIDSVFGIGSATNHSNSSPINPQASSPLALVGSLSSSTGSLSHRSPPSNIGMSLPYISQNDQISPTSPNTESKQDIMNMPSVREKCIRVYGLEKQSHIIKVYGVNDAVAIRDLIYTKFGITVPEQSSWQIFISDKNENLMPINDKRLLEICKTDSEHRGRLFLRKLIGNNPLPSANELEPAKAVIGGNRNIDKIHKFFGETPAPPRSRNKVAFDPKEPIVGPKRTTSLFNQIVEREPEKLKKLGAFFGERPPDEFIVDQMDQFFPSKESNPVLKNLVEANLREKRNSKRASSFMLRRSIHPNEYRLSGRPKTILLKQAELAKLPEGSPLSQIKEGETYTIIPSDSSAKDSETTDDSVITAIHPGLVPEPEKIRVELGAQIGQGAFGKVFIGANIDTGELMAVKQVPGGIEGPQQKKSSDSLEREIAFLSQLNHDNIVRYIGFDSVDGNFNVYLEYVSGGTVASGIAQYGKFDETITRSFTAQILCGLEYLHDRDIIHRDIKGANVLVTSEGVAKISDFGISKKNEYAAYHRMTRLSFQGTVPWMAPEVARGKGYSAKVDIWSCGCLVLEMLSGKLPWHNVRGQVIYLLGTGNAPPIPPSIADAPREFISTTFEIDPEKRPTASDLLDHPFTDIDISKIDFKKWAQEAKQHRQDEGSSSEESSSGDDNDDESSDSLSDDEDDALDQEELFEEVYDQEELPEGILDETEHSATFVQSTFNALEKIQSDFRLESEVINSNKTTQPTISPHLSPVDTFNIADHDDDLYEFDGTVEADESLNYLLQIPSNDQIVNNNDDDD